MSDLNCELMGKFKVFLLGVPLALGVLSGCSEEVEYEMSIYDFVNPSVCFFVSDAATGVNLLDPDEPDAILGRPLALRLEGANEYDRIKGYHLAFGEFDLTDGLKGQSFVVDWGDGTSTKVEFDLYVVWKKNRKERIYEAEVHSPIRVDGAARGEGYYDAWIIRITR